MTNTLKQALDAYTTNNHNGYSNYETWNVSVWLLNDEILYKLAQLCNSYEQFLNLFQAKKPDSVFYTRDFVRLDDPRINIDEVNQAVWGQ